jgi:hypothetical protein
MGHDAEIFLYCGPKLAHQQRGNGFQTEREFIADDPLATSSAASALYSSKTSLARVERRTVGQQGVDQRVGFA